ncbi:hypothetical protein CGX12_04320 [Zobellella denitrificans]|uniref:Uncharacterized protein n=1 Tax=Zobellella denitrificans TaxID=347534 RepID=A0A231N2D6_9GAMM|nr:hypothetical protein [Zobellella denitrificans]ATG74466.1 hypothetical protein AN401_11900 [Zobellella denitrificans]OXS16380.1 hypothetical protein CGX12_04320 [Zobellella denitrificans]
MFIFKVQDGQGGRAEIRIQALDWSEQGEVVFSCNSDALAILLLSGCRSGKGFFSLLPGTKPMYVEQWLEYLQEEGKLGQVEVEIKTPLDPGYGELCGLDSEQIKTLLELVYRVGGFNRLQIMRYLKHRHNPSTMSTRYSPEEITRYRHLGELINYLLRLKSSAP